MNDAILVLEDGRVFRGTRFGAEGQTLGEIDEHRALRADRRDVRREVTIAPGAAVQTIAVSCVEPI